MIRGTDGLDYENPTERLLGNPAETERNGAIQWGRENGFGLGAEEALLALPPGASAQDCHRAVVTADLRARGYDPT